MGSLGIAIGYAIIVGWVVRALFGSLTNSILTTDAAVYFSQATGEFGSIPWHVIVVVLAMAILMFGVSSGIEKINKVLMPSFFVLFAVLAIPRGLSARRGGGVQVPGLYQNGNIC